MDWARTQQHGNAGPKGGPALCMKKDPKPLPLMTPSTCPCVTVWLCLGTSVCLRPYLYMRMSLTPSSGGGGHPPISTGAARTGQRGGALLQAIAGRQLPGWSPLKLKDRASQPAPPFPCRGSPLYQALRRLRPPVHEPLVGHQNSVGIAACSAGFFAFSTWSCSCLLEASKSFSADSFSMSCFWSSSTVFSAVGSLPCAFSS
mmetsp:Transcript_38863/g.64152  ORF Transcript_38863/g.64152 Transcript_38863/m.64152 type:complete len:202 (-) Transcript_38863:215-820(-)